MPSIIPGYEYDIFISYRQNDNKRDKWVTHFVEALKDELEATLKNPVSIYFDENPHDGLLETDHVEASLSKKLKSLVIIPILSQTYCDPNSYAWQKELLPFLDMARNDELGMEIEFRNGNVASRVLPVQIHDLEPDDQFIFENAIGSPLRSIPFIFKSKGVNRPLDSKEEHPQDNQENTYFKDQINKVANALKMLFLALKDPNIELGKSDYRFFEAGALPDHNSITVLPFVNMSGDPEQEYFGDGLAEEIINVLTKVPSLKVTARTSAFSFKEKEIDLRKIGELLSTKLILEGSVRRSGTQLRITAQLINTEDGFHIWSERFDEEWGDIFSIQDRIAEEILNKLKIELTPNQKLNVEKRYTSNPEILNKYLMAKFYYNKRTPEGFDKSLTILNDIVKEEPNFAPAYATMSDCYRLNVFGYGNMSRNEAAIKLNETSVLALQTDPNQEAVHASLGHTAMLIEWDMDKCKYHLTKALAINPNCVEALQWMGWYYMKLHKYDVSTEYFNKAINLDPISAVLITESGWPYTYGKKLNKAKECYQKAIEIDPTYALAYFDIGNILVLQGEIEEGLKLMEQSIAMWGDMSFFIGTMGHFYAKHGFEDKANHYLEILMSRHQEGDTVGFSIADIYEGKSDVENTLKWLQIAVEQKEPFVFFAKEWRNGHLQSNLLEGNTEFKELIAKVEDKSV